VACDRKIEAHRQTIDHKLDPALPALPPPRRSGMQPNRKPIPPFDVGTPLSQIPGGDLTPIDGMGMQTTAVLRSEVGADMSKGKTEKHFASWWGSVPTIRSPVAR
jgi:hypothetical protein